MKPELQAELFQRYPKLFRKPGKRLVDPEVISEFEDLLQDDNGPFDEYGIECGDGWFDLVDRLSAACESEIETLMAQSAPKECWPRNVQIKKKMGGLRFYVNGPLSAVRCPTTCERGFCWPRILRVVAPANAVARLANCVQGGGGIPIATTATKPIWRLFSSESISAPIEWQLCDDDPPFKWNQANGRTWSCAHFDGLVNR